MEFLATAIKELQKSEKYSDLVLRCQGETFKVHCAVICTRSPVFAAAVDGEFMEATTREIDLSADELPAVRAMIDYLYTGDYDDDSIVKSPQSDSTIEEKRSEETPVSSHADHGGQESAAIQEYDLDGNAIPVNNGWGSPLPVLIVDGWGRPVNSIIKKGKKGKGKKGLESSRNPESLNFNVKMYVMGDKYDIPGLKEMAKQKYGAVVIWSWNTEAFSASAEFLWENTMDTDRELRKIVIQAAKDNIGTLMRRPEFVEFMKGHGDFAVNVVRLFI